MISHVSPLRLPPDHLGLYVHVPFCVRKCAHCAFASAPVAADPALPDRVLDALAREAARWRRELRQPLHSIFVGGGTPTALTGGQLRRLWTEVIAPFARLPEAEVTIEANPGTLTDGVLAALAQMPLTRVSLGAQSFHADELAMLWRIYTVDDIEAGVRAARTLGVPAVNLDLMYGLPGQTMGRWAAALDQALALRPEHLSLYALMVEEGTPLCARVRAGLLRLPGEDVEQEMLAEADARLAQAGLARYEVANAARPGAHCRHNLGYWLGRDYVGLGPSAASTRHGVRWRNVDDAAAYAARVLEGRPACHYVERLSAGQRLLERVMLGLRLRGGFDLAEAEEACGCALRDMAGEAFTRLASEECIELDGDVLRLTPRGYPVANDVVARLMSACEDAGAARGQASCQKLAS